MRTDFNNQPVSGTKTDPDTRTDPSRQETDIGRTITEEVIEIDMSARNHPSTIENHSIILEGDSPNPEIMGKMKDCIINGEWKIIR